MPTGTSGSVPVLDAEHKPPWTSSGALLENRAGAPQAHPRISPPLTRPLTLGLLSRTSTASSGSLESTPHGSDIGLHLIHNVEHPSADLILVHGLGGSWLKTWSWKHDPRIFWPSWLPNEEGLVRLRIFSFGYNANFKGASTSLRILDFAKELLFKMLGYGAEEEKIGRVRIALVS